MAVSKEKKPKKQKNPIRKKTRAKQSDVILTPAQLSNVNASIARQHTLNQRYGRLANKMLPTLKRQTIVKDRTTREQNKPFISCLPGTDAFSPLVGHIKPDEFVFSPLDNTHLRLLSVVEMLAEFRE
jgi:hypothetical protein